MFGPSGFFTPNGFDDSISCQEMELIHSSQDGFNDLYRISRNGRLFVYKVLKPEYVGNIMYEDLLRKDFNIGFSLQHGNICQYYAYTYVPEIGNAIVMEWVDGVTLEEMMPKLRKDRKLALKVMKEICDALDYMALKQVYHRDLKPENILVTYNGNNVKIIDFGLSDTDSYSSFKSPAGTRMYASPELLAGEQIDGRSDIWSLGVILTEIGGYPHVASRCLRRDREERYRTAGELYEDLRRRVERRPLFISLALAILAIAGFVVSLLFRTPTEEEIQNPETIVQTVIEDAPPARPEPAQPGPDTLVRSVAPQAGQQPSGAPDQKKNPEEYIDNASLDALLDAASGQLD